MSDGRSDFQSALKDLAASRHIPEDAIPAPEELIAYHHRALPAERMEAMRELLARSPETARLLLDYIALEKLERAPAENTTNQDLVEIEMVPPRVHRGWWRDAAGLLAAAVAGVVIGGVLVAGWVGTDERAGRINVDIHILQPVGEGERGADGPGRPLAPGAVVVLHVPDLTFHETYRLVLLDTDGSELWRVSGLQPDYGLNNFNIQLPFEQFRAATYELLLLGLPDRGQPPLVRYRIRIAS